MKFSLPTSNTKINVQLLEELNKIPEKLPFSKILSSKENKRKKQDFYDIGTIANPEFACYGIFSYENNMDPLAYFKFKLSSISDIFVLPPEHFSCSLV
jgi:hypothetical protein